MARNTPWPDDEIALLREVYPSAKRADLEALFGRPYGTVKDYAIRLGLRKSKEYLNGLKCGGYHERRPVGAEWTCPEGYVWRKVSEERGFVRAHHLVWEEANGPVPQGHHLNFRDGDRSNLDLENLELESDADQMRRISVNNLPAELREVIRLKANITRKIHELEY